MEVSIIVPSFYPAVQYGGPIYTLKDFVEEAIDQGIKIKVYTTDIGIKGKVISNKVLSFNQDDRSKIIYYSVNKFIGKYLSLKLLSSLPQIIKKGDIIKMEDLFSIYVPITFILSLWYKTKIICSPRGVLSKSALSKNKFLKNLYLNLIIRPLSKNILWHATSELEKKQILSFLKNAKVYVIPNGIRIQKSKKNEYEVNDKIILKGHSIFNMNKKTIIGIGRYDTHKRFEILVQSLNYLDPKKYNLILAGPGMPENIKIEELIEDDNILKNVFIFDNLSKLQKWYFMENADLFVLPSKSENFGNVILESLYAGTPVITSDQTPWNMVDEERIGKCLTEISPKTLAYSIVDVFNEYDQYIGMRCKKFASRYNLVNFIDQFKNNFETSRYN